MTDPMHRTLHTARELGVVLCTLADLEPTLRQVSMIEQQLQTDPRLAEHEAFLVEARRSRRLLGALNRARLDIEATK